MDRLGQVRGCEKRSADYLQNMLLWRAQTCICGLTSHPPDLSRLHRLVRLFPGLMMDDLSLMCLDKDRAAGAVGLKGRRIERTRHIDIAIQKWCPSFLDDGSRRCSCEYCAVRAVLQHIHQVGTVSHNNFRQLTRSTCAQSVNQIKGST